MTALDLRVAIFICRYWIKNGSYLKEFLYICTWMENSIQRHLK